MEFQDYYKTLGVAHDASAEDIKKAFRRLARKHHPDMNKAPDAAERMQALNEAHEVLRDPEKRAAYDNIGKPGAEGSPFQPPPGWDSGYEFSGGATRSTGRGAGMGAGMGGFSFGGDEGDPFGGAGGHSDFFEALFGAARRGAGRPQGRAAETASRGQDHHAKIVVPLEDAFTGATRDISLHSPVRDEQGQVLMKDRTLQVSIPKGIRAGQQIRLTGQGSIGQGGGAPGDLYLEIEFKPHDRWRVDGRDVYLTLPVAPWEAALGAPVNVPTPAGTVEMTVPAGSQTGRKLRLRGRGIPGQPPAHAAGDLYVVLELVLPPAADERSRAVYEQLARDLPFNPRAHLEGHA